MQPLYESSNHSADDFRAKLIRTFPRTQFNQDQTTTTLTVVQFMIGKHGLFEAQTAKTDVQEAKADIDSQIHAKQLLIQQLYGFRG